MRKANERIALLRQYLESPTGQKVRRSPDDPYFFGQSEREWRQEQNALHRDIQGASYRDRRDIQQELIDTWHISPKEAELMVRYSANPRRQVSRHVAIGVPHATVSEDIARLALNASGTDTRAINQGNPFATDLETMIDNVRAYVDVQNRYIIPGAPDIDTISVLNNVRPNVSQQVFGQASQNDTVGTIVKEIVNRSPDAGYDKLLHTSPNAKIGKVPEDQVKDYLIGGLIDPRRVNNQATRASQGSYDPMAPKDIEVTDMGKLRSALQGMTKGELTSKKVKGSIIRQEPQKLKLRIPHEIVREISRPDSELVSQEVINMLNYYA